MFVVLRVLAFQALGYDPHFRACLVDGYAWAELCDNLEIVVVAVLKIAVGEAHGRPQLHVGPGIAKALAHYAKDDKRLAVQIQATAENARITRELVLPD